MYHLQADQAVKVAAEQRADRMRGSQYSRIESFSEAEKPQRSKATARRTVLAVLVLAGMLIAVARPLYASHTATHLTAPTYALPQGYFVQEKMYRPPTVVQIQPSYAVPADYFRQEKTCRAPNVQRVITPDFSVPTDYFMHEKTDRAVTAGPMSNLKPLTEYSVDEATAYRWQAMARFYAQQAGQTALTTP